MASCSWSPALAALVGGSRRAWCGRCSCSWRCCRAASCRCWRSTSRTTTSSTSSGSPPPPGRRGRSRAAGAAAPWSPPAGVAAVARRGARITTAACARHRRRRPAVGGPAARGGPRRHRPDRRPLHGLLRRRVPAPGGPAAIATWRPVRCCGPPACSAGWCWAATCSTGWPPERLALVAAAGGRPGPVMVLSAAVATGRGWRSAWWSRRAEVAESLVGRRGRSRRSSSSSLGVDFLMLWELTSGQRALHVSRSRTAVAGWRRLLWTAGSRRGLARGSRVHDWVSGRRDRQPDKRSEARDWNATATT